MKILKYYFICKINYKLSFENIYTKDEIKKYMSKETKDLIVDI